MTTESLDISEARRQFTSLDERLRKHQVIWVTRRNKKAFALIGTELLETVLETIEILSDPEALAMLQQGLQDVRAGRLYDHEAVKSELLDEAPGLDPVDRNRPACPAKTATQGSARPAGKGRRVAKRRPKKGE
jgi:PHD/YefM family antitoxin component YafN of YafNO toxin-antitoxin module